MKMQLKDALRKLADGAANLGVLIDKHKVLDSNWGKGTNMHTARIVYEKYVNGGSINDEELKYAIEFFQDLTPKLFALGPTFKLAASEAIRCLNALEGFQTARANK